MNQEPLISFVMITFNRGGFIEAALKGLIEERDRYYANMEIIVIDGGSKDKTLEIIKKYEHEFAFWVSEPDKGPADAFSKGIKKAKGDLIRYVSDDDRMIPGCTRRMVEIMLNHPGFDIVGGQIKSVYTDSSGKVTPVHNQIPHGNVTLAQMSRPDIEGFLIPEACLFKKKIFTNVGYWDNSFGAACDFNFFLKALKDGVKIFISDEIFLHKYWHDDSIVLRTMQKLQWEIIRSIKQSVGIKPAAAYYYRVMLRPWIKNKGKVLLNQKKIINFFARIKS